MNDKIEPCYICDNDAKYGQSKYNAYNTDNDLNILKCDCVNCGIFFPTIVEGVGKGVDKKVFAPYLSNENARRRCNMMSMSEREESSKFFDVLCIVSEEQKKSTEYCDNIKDVLLSVKWVTEKDRIHFITNKDAKEWYDKKVQRLSGT